MPKRQGVLNLIKKDFQEMDQDTRLATAHTLLQSARQESGILLRAVHHDPLSESATLTFRCPRASGYPNPNLAELTGGQINDIISQSAYATLGFLMLDGLDIFGLDLEGFSQLIYRHRVNYARFQLDFMAPTIIDADVVIQTSLVRFPDTSTSIRKQSRSSQQEFGLIQLTAEGWQDTHQGARQRRFSAQLLACCRYL